MFKNTAGQIWVVFAYEDEGATNPGEPVTGNAASISANLRLDGAAANATDDVNPEELEGGFYFFTITQVESNADNIVISPSSVTGNVNVIGAPAVVYTRDYAAGAITAILTDTGTTLDTKLDDIQGATFATGTDSLEAIRNRGDSAWTGSLPTSDSGTAQAGSTTTMTLEAGFPSTDDILVGQLIFLTAGTGAPASAAIDSYDGTTGVATIIGTWPGGISPDNTTVYDIYPDDIDEINDPPTAATIADAIWDENTVGHTNAGTFGEQCKSDIDAILVDTSSTLDAAIGVIDGVVDAILLDTAEIGTAGAGLSAVPWNASWDAEVQSECTDALNAYDPPTKAEMDTLVGSPAGASVSADILAIKTETANILTDTGTTLDTLLNTVDGKLDTIDTVVDAIKTKTDSLTFTVAGEVDTNVESINAATVIGAGTSGNLWRA